MEDNRSPNERILDAQILWQVLLLRYSFFVRQRVVQILNGTEKQVATEIRGALAAEPGFRDPSKLMLLEQLMQRLERVRRQAWDAGTQVVEAEFTNLSQAEVEQQDNLYGLWLPSRRKPLWLITAAAALAAPVQGRTVRKWLADAANDDAKRMRTALFAGVGLGERPDAIARRIVGSARAKGADGATQVSRNHIDTIVRTGVIHVSANTRDQFFRLNPQVLDLEQLVAVLDSHTTKLCRGLDGNRYPLGVGPIPPLHMGCRTIRYALLPKVIGGPVPEPEVYGAWIRRQPRVVQIELMGATRAQRMRAGSFDPGRFADYGSKEMSLEQVVAAARRLMGRGV